MSSDSDEDELLQRALKEQSRGRASSSNSRAPPRPTAKGRKQRTRSEVEEDEDSEVELLSISSGDEEVSKVEKGGAKREARGYDRPWDGEEPDCWKRVDESELARRVREMRETRTAPVAQKFEKKPSVKGKMGGLNNLLSIPRGMECIDPLGLGIIDNKTLRLITESLDYSPTKDRLDNALREKLLYFSENFDPKLFLSRIHQHTPAADLEAGACALKDDLRGRTMQRKQLVKDNFDCFVSCKTTIDDIESKLNRIEEDPEGSGTSHLYNCMQDISSVANRALEPLFERQAQAERIRSVQGMLQRFRTLFNLPSTIRASITNGEFELAVREYKKAKSIALPSHVNILKRVQVEVEKVMQEFKGTLLQSMEDPHIDLTTLENTVRMMLEIDPESDPVWHYLNVQNDRIRGLLEQCTWDYEVRLDIVHNDIRERALSDARWKKLQQDPDEPVNVEYSPAMPVDFTGGEVDAVRGKYIRRLTAVLIHHIPAFWKIALTIFSGKFAKSSQVSTESKADDSANKNEEKAGDRSYSMHSIDEVVAMIRSTISTYEVKVNTTFRDFEELNIRQPFMTDAIEEVSRAIQSFEAKESTPPIAVTALRMLKTEILKVYILRLCSWMRLTTEELSREETWIPISVLERSKSPYKISFLPLEFREVISSAMDHISMMIQSLSTEAQKLEDMLAQVQETQESVRLAFLNCLLDFAGNLEQIGEEVAQNNSSKDLQLKNGFSHETDKKSLANLVGSIQDPHQQLLMVLSNIGFCKDELAFVLYNKYREIWVNYRDREEEETDIHDLIMSFSGLEEKVLAQYTFTKADLIRTAAMKYLVDSGVYWGAAPAVKGIRDAAIELLHTLVAVHSEAFAGAKPLLEKTLGMLVEGLIDTFLSIFHENISTEFSSLDVNGFCQLMLELEYFETILNPYLTHVARESLKSLQGVLLEKATENLGEAAENPGVQRKTGRGGEDEFAEKRQQGIAATPDDLIALAQQCSMELLQSELERTRINTACFMDLLPLDAFKGSMDTPAKSNQQRH